MLLFTGWSGGVQDVSFKVKTDRRNPDFRKHFFLVTDGLQES